MYEDNSKQETYVYEYGENFEAYTEKLFQVISILRINFVTPDEWRAGKIINAIITSIMFGLDYWNDLCHLLACYSAVFTTYVTFSGQHSPIAMSSKLLVIAWAIQAIMSMAFLVYWQLYGHMKSYQKHVVACQNGAGLKQGKCLLKTNISWFYTIIALEITIILLFNISYYMEVEHTEFAIQQSKMFYFPELRFVNSFVTLYTYIIWNISMFVYIIYTNAAFLEILYFNGELEKLDASSEDIQYELLQIMEVYGRLTGVVRELDRIFRLYAFIMIVIIIPSVIFTLMMLNQRIHGWKDLVICLPSIALCAYSFLAVTVAPARLHDEVSRSRICLIRNKSIWFPYRKDVFQIAMALSSHMEQYDLGISIWGFAILSRPLILATFSVMTMVLSVLIELTPLPLPFFEWINCSQIIS